MICLQAIFFLDRRRPSVGRHPVMLRPSIFSCRLLRIAIVLAAIAAPRGLHAACNIIPSASKAFRSSLGATNRPFAAPGDFVEVTVDPQGCDAASTGFAAVPLHQLLT